MTTLALASADLGGIPSPSQNVWYLGPLPIRAYALAIGLGILVGWWLLDRRYRAKGGDPAVVSDVTLWMVLFGIVGARLYHVVTTPAPYFGENGDPLRALRIWEGGLGVWGAIAGGALGAFIVLRRRGLRLAPVADAAAPALLFAQAIGRLGNYFNQELFGAPTTLPWGLRIDAAHIPEGYEAGTLFHPTFAYEMLWNISAGLLLLWLAKRFGLRHGRVFWLYVMLYTSGRVWIEMLRIDDAELIFGERLNVWTSIATFLIALYAFVKIGRATRGVPESLWLPGREPAPQAGGDGDDDGMGGHDGEQDDESGADELGADDPGDGESVVDDGDHPRRASRDRADDHVDGLNAAGGLDATGDGIRRP